MLLRNSGPPATAELISTCVQAGERLGLDDLWVLDHIAIPPDEAQGSGGRYLDPLATLAYAAALTTRIGLGVAVLVLPYRPVLATAKWVASIQELCGGRLNLGVGVGWMAAEFKAAGVDRARRGVITDEVMQFLHDCFAEDEVELNGQTFLFKPRPARPPLLVGGGAPHATNRAVRYGDGWMPMTGDIDKLRQPVAAFKADMAAAGKPDPDVIPLTALPLDDIRQAADKLAALAELGVTGIEHTARYSDVDEFCRMAEGLLEARSRAGL
jgi:probable F420-dependent oxidoreductase